MLNTPLPYFKAGVLLLASVYLAGIWGLNHPSADAWIERWTFFKSFTHLTPINLFITATLLYVFQPDKNDNFITFMAIVTIGGYLVELLGVHTGAIFGQYQYGDVLGGKWWDVPPLIGINWWILQYSACQITYRWTSSKWIQLLLPALILVMMDILIEPVAMAKGFWMWHDHQVPLQNYVAWFVVSLIFSIAYHQLGAFSYNFMAFPVLMAQILFFGITNLLLTR